MCTAPDKCECIEGYVYNQNTTSVCEPQCADDCVNGNCVAPDTCECNENYQFENVSSNVCEPICDPPCKKGKCNDFFTCACYAGYSNSETEQNRFEFKLNFSIKNFHLKPIIFQL